MSGAARTADHLEDAVMMESRNGELPRRWAVLPLRLIVGFGFIAHGVAKWSRGPGNFGKLLDQIGAPLPTATAWVVTLVEVFGGLAILVGAFVAIASVPLIVSMLVAMFTVQLRYGFSAVNTIGLTPSGPVFGPPGYEINLLYIAALLAVALAGPGTCSVDRWRGRRW
jgi:putative oxidoreductase